MDIKTIIEGNYDECLFMSSSFNNSIHIRHFILTRFNLLIWNKDKTGSSVRTIKWLEHRFSLFERYCIPSVKGQTCKNFEWIVLFDSTTPDRFKDKIADYQKDFSQFVPVFVEPDNGRYFANIFQEEVRRRLPDSETGRVLTTYLDNDDALNVKMVEDLQNRVEALHNGTFIFYTDGYQYFTDERYLMLIYYKKNHFVSVIEGGEKEQVKTIYGYGSHYYIDKIKDVRIEYVSNEPMWCQVVHEKNMGNDAYFLAARMIRDKDLLQQDFGLQENVNYGIGLYMQCFLPRYAKTFARRLMIKVRGYRFE